MLGLQCFKTPVAVIFIIQVRAADITETFQDVLIRKAAPLSWYHARAHQQPLPPLQTNPSYLSCPSIGMRCPTDLSGVSGDQGG